MARLGKVSKSKTLGSIRDSKEADVAPGLKEGVTEERVVVDKATNIEAIKEKTVKKPLGEKIVAEPEEFLEPVVTDKSLEDNKSKKSKGIKVDENSNFKDPRVVGFIVQEAAANKDYASTFRNTSPPEFIKRLGGVAKIIGGFAFESCITLYLTLKQELLPKACAAIIIAVLGYLISPIDAVPDLLPLGVGLMDDVVLILWACKQLASNITRETRVNAAKITQTVFQKLGVTYKSSLLKGTTEASEVLNRTEGATVNGSI